MYGISFVIILSMESFVIIFFVNLKTFGHFILLKIILNVFINSLRISILTKFENFDHAYPSPSSSKSFPPPFMLIQSLLFLPLSPTLLNSLALSLHHSVQVLADYFWVCPGIWLSKGR